MWSQTIKQASHDVRIWTMKKRFIIPAALCGMAMLLNGCVSSAFRSMASSPTPVVHQPRLNPEKKDVEKTVSIDAFGLFNDSWFNTEGLYGGGASLGGILRGGGAISPLFASVNFTGFGGKVNFNCDVPKNCSNTYKKWLDSEDGKDDYSFWALQELLNVGAEFNTPINVFLGLSGGVRLFQGGGDFDDQRDKIEKVAKTRNLDDGYGVSPTASLWLGYHIGKEGKYGSVSLQYSWAKEYDNDETLTINVSPTLSYFHPSGFHGGINIYSKNSVNVYMGKSFTF